MEIALYIREDSPEDGERQLSLCREYCVRRYPDALEANLYRDSAVPGEHPELDRLLADALAGTVTDVVCAGLEDICYSTAELAALLEALGERGATFCAVRDSFDTAAPLGRVLAYTAAALARLDRQGAARRVRDSMRALARDGRWLGGVPPTGYHSQKIKENGVTTYALTPIPGEVALVQRIFSEFLTLNSLTEVERRLTGAGIRTKNGRAFSRFSIRQILENPVYMLADGEAFTYFSSCGAKLCSDREQFNGIHGMMVYNKTVQEAGKPAKNRPIEEWVVAVGRHEGIVTGRDWLGARRLLDQNKSPDFRKPRSAHALMPGILRCAACGAYMRPKQTKRQTEDGEQMFIYLCERKEQTKSMECTMKNVSGNLLDRVVCDQLRGLQPDSPGLVAQIRHSSEAARVESDPAEIRRLEEQKAEVEKGISDLVFTLVKIVDKSAYDYVIRQIDDLHGENAELQARIDQLKAVERPHPLTDDEVGAAQGLLQSFQEDFDELSVEQKRAALRAMIQRAVWDGERVQVFLHGHAAQ